METSVPECSIEQDCCPEIIAKFARNHLLQSFAFNNVSGQSSSFAEHPQMKLLFTLKSISFQNVYRSSRQQIFCKSGGLKIFAKFTGKHMCRSFLFNKNGSLHPATLLKIRPRHRYFSMGFAKFLRIYFFQNNSGRLFYARKFQQTIVLCRHVEERRHEIFFVSF